MKLEIDTKSDSREEIMHAIRLLQKAVGEEIMSNSAPVVEEEKQEAGTAGFVNAFKNYENDKLQRKIMKAKAKAEGITVITPEFCDQVRNKRSGEKSN